MLARSIVDLGERVRARIQLFADAFFQFPDPQRRQEQAFGPRQSSDRRPTGSPSDRSRAFGPALGFFRPASWAEDDRPLLSLTLIPLVVNGPIVLPYRNSSFPASFAGGFGFFRTEKRLCLCRSSAISCGHGRESKTGLSQHFFVRRALRQRAGESRPRRHGRARACRAARRRRGISAAFSAK